MSYKIEEDTSDPGVWRVVNYNDIGQGWHIATYTSGDTAVAVAALLNACEHLEKHYQFEDED